MENKWTYLAMEFENRKETKEKADFLKRIMLADRSSIFEKTKLYVLSEAFTYLENGGGEDLTMPEIKEWFDKAKSEIIKQIQMQEGTQSGEGEKP